MKDTQDQVAVIQQTDRNNTKLALKAKKVHKTEEKEYRSKRLKRHENDKAKLALKAIRII